MIWCVCLGKDGSLTVLSRSERESMLTILMDIGSEIPSFVVKTFDEKQEAEEYIKRIENINQIIEGL